MNSRRVVLLGLDSCDPALAQRFAAQGLMPNLQRLLSSAARAPVTNPYGLFVGALWVNFATALRAERHGFYCWEEIDPRTYEHRLITPRVAHLPPFWNAVSEAGGRVAVIDVPHMTADQPLNGFQLVEWGCHDKHFGLHSSPPEFAAQVEAEFGLHPALKGAEPSAIRNFAPDDEVHRAGRLRQPEEERALLADLLAGARTKRQMVSALMARDAWDLFMVIYGEAHAAGHQQWHLHDPRHPRFDPAAVEMLGGDPMAQVYAELDQAIGEAEAATDPDSLFMVHLSHGIGPHFDGTHLLEEILVRLDRQQGLEGGEGDAAAKLSPNPVVALLGGTARALKVPARVRNRLGAKLEALVVKPAEARAARRYFQEPNNTVYGGVRLNLVGREPRGLVRPEDADAVIEQLRRDLLQIVNVATGKPVVRAVERTDRWHKRSPTDTFPDLLVDWDRSALVETVASPKIGIVHIPYSENRTGDHRPAGLLLARATDLPPGVRMPGLAVEDIGPSIAARLGVSLPDVDGAVAGWLAGSAAPTPVEEVA